MLRHCILQNTIAAHTNKTNAEITRRLHSTLAKVIAVAVGRTAVIILYVTSRGAGNGDGFGSSFFGRIDKQDEAGEVALGPTLYGLRHRIGALTKEDAASEADLAIALGRKTLAKARYYPHEANRRTRMVAATIIFAPMRKAKPKA